MRSRAVIETVVELAPLVEVCLERRRVIREGCSVGSSMVSYVMIYDFDVICLRVKCKVHASHWQC